MVNFFKWLRGYEIVICYKFNKPPFGGANQFMLALYKEFLRSKTDIGLNRITKKTKYLLFNSFIIDYQELIKIKRNYPKLHIIHRMDGPISLYRGQNNIDIDAELSDINMRVASRTIFQSQFSLQKHQEMGLEFKNPVIISNAADATIFNTSNRILPPNGKRKIKIIASSWSDNPKKGGPTYKWLEDHLDWDKYEFTFVGRTKQKFEKIRIVDACPSEELANLLKNHDIYITASQEDPCSNALIEALSCGLPVAFLNSGGHPELVKEAGEAFINNEDILVALEKISKNYEHYQSKIQVDSIENITEKYLQLMK
jgi:glycosyltransferase involved in cell wall biosynthesis